MHVYYMRAVPKEARSECWVWNLVTGVCELPDVCETTPSGTQTCVGAGTQTWIP